MKKLILLLILTISTVAVSKDLSNEIINYFDKEISQSIKLHQENALIKSQKDLEFYLTIKDKAFPLNLLNEKDKVTFVESLKFNDAGLTSYNYTILENLKEDDVFKILALFGFENNTTIIKKPNENRCLMMKCNDYVNYKCVGRGSCQQSTGYICTSNC